ncbi:MAG: hypothetical protein PHG25_02450 [Candidatus Pacebacteria bacterium]|nr:hypothetical protein [Candidatus Paceibacterota bacterium]
MKKIRIAGFGACMISGKPFGQENSFFSQAVNHLKEKAIVESLVTSLAGFPIDRASEHLEKQVLRKNPTHVVIQFSSVDIASPYGYSYTIKQRLGLTKMKRSHSDSCASSRNSSSEHLEAFFGPLKQFDLVSNVRRFIKGRLGVMLNIEPRTNRAVYLETMKSMVHKIKGQGAEPIVLLPFPFLDLWSDCQSGALTKHVRCLSRELGFRVLETRKILEPYPRHRIFLNNGMHITQFAHALLGRELAEIVITA